VLTLSDMLSPTGGAERLAGLIAMRLDPERFERTLCITRWDPTDPVRKPEIGEFKDELEESGVELILIERDSKLDVAALRPLWQRLRSGTVDVLHAHKHGSNVWGTALGRAARVPVVIAHEHAWSFEGQPVRKLLDRELIARGSDVLIAVSRHDRERMIDIERIPPDGVLMLPNGIPSEQLQAAGDLRGELGIGAEDPVVGAVAVLREEKALDLLVRAARVLVDEFPRLRVIVAGEGPLRAPLEELIDELGLHDVVQLLGTRSDVPEVVATLDVGVLCSRFEGGPLAVMEYMAGGKPVVATRVGGMPYLVEDGITGLLVEPGDPDALAAGIGELLRDPERAAQMGRAGQAVQLREHDLAVMVRRIEDLYETLLAEKGAPARNGRPPRLAVERAGSLEELREEWTELAERAGSPFQTWEWADAWWRVYGDGELRLTALRRPGGELAAILPLYASRRAGLRLLRFIGHGPGDRLGPVCAPEDSREVALAMRRALADAGGWDLFAAERLPGEQHWAEWLGGPVLRTESSPYLRFAGDWEAYLASRSRNFRDQARRRERKLRREHEVEFRLCDDPARLDDDLSTLIRLHEMRWADDEQDSQSFAPDREALHRDFARRALERGWLRLWHLEVDGEAVAAWYGFRFGGAEWFYQSGRDPAREDQSVGFVMMVHTIRSALDDGIQTYHLLRGGEDYKSRFASGDDGLDTVLLTGTARGRAAGATATRALALSPRVRGAVRRAAGRD
jgi:glycosyltransferase involved in cell wall biosynthesis/CelD/BcsL family acetyltransferase involved in cellulose biosynthesis